MAKSHRRSTGSRPAAKPLVAFVLMPFGPLPDHVFDILIRPALVATGYEARRADTTLNQRAIMRDVVEGIQTADLILADLSGRNPNVFYELGIAHALRKKVILLAQTTDDIPFDLKAYRTYIYRLEFGTGLSVRNTLGRELRQLLRAAKNDQLAFGSPFSDYEGVAADWPNETTESGILETIAEAVAAAPKFIDAMERITRLAGDFSAEQRVVTARLNNAPKGAEVTQALSVAADLAVLWTSYADKLEPIVDRELIPSALSVETGMVAARRLSALGRPKEAEQLEVSLRNLAGISGRTAQQVGSAASAIRQLSQISSPLKSAGERLAGVLDRVSATFERIGGLSSIARARSGG